MSTELATIEQAASALQEVPMSPEELHAQVQLIQRIMEKVMIKDQHYGKIPGCGPKPTLLKPGAEKLQLTFKLRPFFDIKEVDLAGHHKSFRVTCTMKNFVGDALGQGVGMADTREKKWRSHDDAPWDIYNTALKIAKKRAQVDAVLTCTAASDIFTQDIEEMQPETARQPATSEASKILLNKVWKNVVISDVEKKPYQDNPDKYRWLITLGDHREVSSWDDKLAEKLGQLSSKDLINLTVQEDVRKKGRYKALDFEPVAEPPQEDDEGTQENLGW
jgi:hypothetical protein